MRVCSAAVSVLAIGVNLASPAVAQTPAARAPEQFPRTLADIGEWDAAIVRRAAATIATPAQWNRSDKGPCNADAKTVSLRCALENAASVITRQAATSLSVDAPSSAPRPAECRLTNVNGRMEGSCGLFFDEPTVFSVARAKGITTGSWRSDVEPNEVWAGHMLNAEAPVLQQARRLVDVIAPGKYRNARLAEFNDDSTVTFADLQAFFRALEQRVRGMAPADLVSAADDVEIELYAGGAGIVRTYNGWYSVSRFTASNATVGFQVDTSTAVVPNVVDREIIVRANALLSSDAVWNRNDNRQCDAAAKTWSIYCALEHATREVTGGFHHRRPALELVRVIVDERTKDRNYSHRLMDYNNDASTKLDDVRSLFAEALRKIP
jgi:hypothetical protein